MPEFNELSQSVLEKRYYGPGETKPEDLFMRVARVCSIPSVIDQIVSKKYDNEYIPDYLDIFHPYEEEYKRAAERRGLLLNLFEFHALGL